MIDLKICINEKDYEIIINRKGNKNTYIRVNDQLQIEVSTRRFASSREIERLVHANLDKIEKMLDRRSSVSESEFEVYLKSSKYRVIIISNLREVEISDDSIYGPSLKKINDYVDSINYDYFKELLDKNYSKFSEKIPYPKLRIRKMKSRWGVCNRVSLTVTLNSNLMRFKEEIIEYVIIHELAHFVHFNHSSNFWKTVEFYCPNYKKLRKELKG